MVSGGYHATTDEHQGNRARMILAATSDSADYQRQADGQPTDEEIGLQIHDGDLQQAEGREDHGQNCGNGSGGRSKTSHSLCGDGRGYGAGQASDTGDVTIP